MLSTYVVGAKGRMGQLLCAAVEERPELTLAGRFDVDNICELDEAAPAADLVIDFSSPAALPHVAAFVRRTHASLVSGTTGLSEDDLAVLSDLGKCARVVWSSNYSLGVAVLRRVTAEVARVLDGWDAEIVETHHNMKADAPSGTAKTLFEAIDSASGGLELVCGREGIVGARTKREVGMHSVRGGTVAGTHEVHFFGPDEELCLTHRATSRQIFVAGAVACAVVLAGSDVGLHTFDDLMLG